MKTFSKCLAVALAVAGAATLAGCSKSTPNYKTATTANWNVRTSAAVEENSFEFWQNQMEVATYSVSFKEGENSSYTVSYNDGGVYTTQFYMTTFDWATDTIDGYKTEESETEYVYVYETSLTISGTYTMKSGGATKDFSDELVTKSYFRTAGKNLKPVYSYQKVKNTTPAELTVGSIGSSYVEIDEVYETFYNKKCSQATVIRTKANGEPTTKKIGLSSDYSNFDNSQLRAAVRAFTLSGGSSRTFRVVTPQNSNLQSVTAKITKPAELDPDKDKTIIDALDNAPDYYIFFNGEVADKKEDEKDRTYRYSSVSLSINASLKGASSTMWYSTVENNDLNGTRCVLLKISTPLSFGLGTLTYTLNSLEIADNPNN